MTKKQVSEWSDQDVVEEIERLHKAIQAWAERNELWHDAGFSSKLDRSGEEPWEEDPVVTLFHADGSMHVICDSGFSEFLESLGYWYEQEDNVTLAIYAHDEGHRAKFYEYFYWQWVCSLLIEDTGDVHEELYQHFSKKPDDLYRLNWREFEILLFRIFQNHGYSALLGPGRADGGVDLRLWQPNPIGDILTVVQAKRYAPGNKIDLLPVQAIYGAAKAELAAHAMFVTTSSYTPAAHQFAARVSSELQLRGNEDVVAWCEQSTRGVIKDKSRLVARSAVSRLLEELASNPFDSRVVHGTWGYNATHNRYAVVIKETKHAALLLSIRAHIVSHDGYGQVGAQIPMFDAASMNQFNAEGVVRAQRNVDERGRVWYWTGRQHYSRWDGQPNYFNHMD
ncbi:restriction endonuclease [Herbaspirillum seropedicae]|uniref:restriction endonuclease n=1 Tax=Herbaspirillum seropedicae TaxID=964 RepID=UPI0015DF79A5|nr:restriction endonuclease [Herbaspirillum seropedicae]